MAINILIIEDDESIRRVIKKILEGENKNYKIIEAIDGKDGLIKINENQLNLILCDIKKDLLRGLKITNDLDTKGSQCMHLLSLHLECLESSPSLFDVDQSPLILRVPM